MNAACFEVENETPPQPTSCSEIMNRHTYRDGAKLLNDTGWNSITVAGTLLCLFRILSD